MIKLRTFIPEIKIVPNQKLPDFGEVWWIKTQYREAKYKIEQKYNDDFQWINLKYRGDSFWMTPEQFEQKKKLGEIKYVKKLDLDTDLLWEIKIIPNTNPKNNEELLKYFIRYKAEILDTILSTTEQEFYRKNHLYLSFRWMGEEPFISTIKYVGAVEITDQQHIHYLYLSLQPLEDGHFGNIMNKSIKYKGITIYYAF